MMTELIIALLAHMPENRIVQGGLLSLDLHVRPFEKLVRVAVQDGTERTVRNIKKIIETDLIDIKK